MRRSSIKHTRRLRGYDRSATEVYSPADEAFKVRKGARRLRRLRRERNWYYRTFYSGHLPINRATDTVPKRLEKARARQAQAEGSPT